MATISKMAKKKPMSWFQKHTIRDLFLNHYKSLFIWSALASIVLGISWLMASSPSNQWDSEKNRETLMQKVSFDNDCPIEKIEVIQKYDNLKSYRLNVCGKTMKYKAWGVWFSWNWKHIK